MKVMQSRTVLLVDDEIEILRSLERLFRKEPYQLAFAQSGQKALSILENKTVHVIVTDLGMPEMDGLTLLNLVQARYPGIIRLVFSAHGDRNTILKAINKGNIFRYIIKPWDNIEIKLIVRQAIEQFNLEQERRDLLRKLEEYNLLLKEGVQQRTRQLLAIQKQAEIGKYASQIVHNLHSPLQAMLGSLDHAHMIVSDEDPDLQKLVYYFHLIQSGISDIQRIIGGILVHVKDGAPFKTHEVDINTVIEQELEFFEINPIYKSQIHKEIRLMDNLPRIQGNPIHFKQVIDNLLKNAVDAMEHSLQKQLTVKTYMEDKALCIGISDTGEGIYKDHLGKIFSPDFTTKPSGKGTGLGLASVKTMVDAYSGSITVESERGKGATFVVSIPIEP